MPLVNTPDKEKKFPERHTYSVTATSIRPEIGVKESILPARGASA
jgi:hypothetical protein